MLRFLDKFETAGDEALSLYIPPSLPLPDIENLLEKVLDKSTIDPDLAVLAARSKTGAVLFWGLSQKCLILPPFPITENYFTNGYAIKPLYSLLTHDFIVALILVRLGAYAIGVCQGENIITSKVGTGLVHARHKKGGSSAKRFERHREKQIEYFLDRVCNRVQEKLEPKARMLDYLIYGGARTTIISLQKRCSFLSQFDDRTLPPLLDIPEPRQAVLETAVKRVWSTTVTEWYENEVLA